MEENKLKQEVRYTDSVVAQEPLFPQVKVNLNSPAGNAIVIMAVVNNTLEATNYAPELRSKVLSEMKQASSYQNLCDIVGRYITLYRSEHYEKGALFDRENNNEKRRHSWKFILNHFNSNEPPFHYYPKIVDLDRFEEEMNEINYTFKITTHRKKKK